MGQYWQLINLDKRQTTGHLGKLGEFLFCSTPRILLPLLSRPIVLPAIFEETAQALVDKSSLGNLQLPVETLRDIFDEIDNLQDAIFLGITNKLLLTIGQNRIHALLTAYVATWAGDRIICLGDYARDSPDGMLTDAETQELQQGGMEIKEDSDEDEDEDADADADRSVTDCEPVSLYNLASLKFQELERHRHPKLPRSLSWSDRELFSVLTEARYSLERWVLCNISKQEYVREEAFEIVGSTPDTLHDLVVHTGYGKVISFGEVLMCRICWSTDSSVSLGYDGGIHRGVWAGDRFEITTRAILESRLEVGEAWTDVSEEVVKEVIDIWEADMGSGIWKTGQK